MTNALPLLKAVRARLDRPEALCKGAFARNARGSGVSANDKDAVAWDLAGAVYAERGKRASGDVETLATALRFKDAFAMSRWQDDPTTTHADIIARLDEAIEREEMNV